MTISPGLLLSNASDSLYRVLQDQPALAPLIGPVAALVAALAADVDTYVSDRLQRAQQIKSILLHARRSAPVSLIAVLDQALASGPSEPEAFSAASVDAYLAALKMALIEVHSWQDGAEPGNANEEIVEQIWAFAKQEVRHLSRSVPSLL